MKTTKMLKKNYEFKQVLSKGNYYAGENIIAFILKNNQEINFLGLAVSTKIGKAYQRNRIKRLLRENYKNIEKSLKKGYSIVFLIKKNKKATEINFKKIEKDMIHLFNHAKIIDSDG